MIPNDHPLGNGEFKKNYLNSPIKNMTGEKLDPSFITSLNYNCIKKINSMEYNGANFHFDLGKKL